MGLSLFCALINTVPHQNQIILDVSEESQKSSVHTELTVFSGCHIFNLVTLISWHAAIHVLCFKHLTNLSISAF